MHLPLRHVSGHLVWTTHGTVWAVYRVTPANLSHVSAAQKKRRLQDLEALFRSLVGEPLLLSLCPQVDPVSVVRSMVDDIDLDRSPRYEALGHRVLDQLETMELTGRTDWLAIPLPAKSALDAVRTTLRAGMAQLSQQLGLLPAPITTREIDQRLAQAEQMRTGWPAGIEMRPATEAEILWIYGHSVRRGISEPLLPAPGDPGTRGRGHTTAALNEFVLAEGVDSDDQDHEQQTAFRNPFKKRYLRVASPFGDSYQALMVLSQMPDAFAWPGAAYFAEVDEQPYPVDWSARLVITPGTKAEAKGRHRARHLNTQREEYEDDPAGAPASVEHNAKDNDEMRERMLANQREVEIRAMVTVAVWGPTPDEAMNRAAAFAADFGSSDYTFVAPLNQQTALWESMLPGCRAPRVMLNYAQYLLSRDFALSLPWCGSQLGDERGGLIGVQHAGGGARPVLIDFASATRRDANASLAVVGENGGGKSVCLKSAMYDVLSRGRRTGRPNSRSRAVIIDRTKDAEWLRYANACPGTTRLITIDEDARVSIDPLRLYASRPKAAARYVESFLVLLLDVRPMNTEGVALSEAVEAVLERPHPSMRALIDELFARSEDDPAAHSLARKLRSVSKKDLAACVFDPNLPLADTHTADTIVFGTNELQLPKASELDNAHRFERLEWEKVFGRAVMYLIAAVARETAVANRDEFAVCIVDECWWLTENQEGLELVTELVLDGRKRAAAVFLGAPDVHHIGGDSQKGRALRGLFKHRMAFRQTDKGLARRALAFLGADPDDKELLETITSRLSPVTGVSDDETAARKGECLYRDLAGRIGRMRVLIPDDDQAAAQIHTTPGRDTRRPAARPARRAAA